MSRVIKNNDGVAVVEGTPSASLVKDVEKFFASKPPERMAGESISQPRRLTQFTEEEIADKRGEIFKRLKDGSRRQVRPVRNVAKQKAESRRERFFERRRSAKEAERSQKERDATKGKFISTLGR